MENIKSRFLVLGLLFVSPLFVRAAAAQNPVQIENAKPGTTDWQLANYASNHQIEGYANLTSVHRGSQIEFFVNTIDPNFTIEIFRTGWYGGTGGRRITSPVQVAGTAQPAPYNDSVTGLIECNWTNPYVLQIPNDTSDPTDWLSGVYLAKLTSSSGYESYIVFVVRDDSRPSDYLFQSSVNTYQAYNNWGGRSLYAYNSDFQARKVSFNRPYADSQGAGQYLGSYEYPMVRFLEREGYDVTYATDLDLHENPNLLQLRKAGLIVGHGEYWSWQMRTNITAARDSGVNLGFLGSNNCYWQVRFEPSIAGGVADRTMVGYKDYALTEDPYYTNGNPSEYYLVTTNWRAYPVNLPEDALIGILYANVVQTGDIVVYNASNWVFNTTGLQNGSHLPGLMGVEVDTLDTHTPPGTILLSHSPYQISGSTEYSDMTVYTAASGATVFAAGTMIWSWGLDNFNGGPVNAAAQQMTRNLLARFISDQPPISNPGGPYTGFVSEGLQFNGSGSSDPDGTIATYQWDFGDGSTGTGATPTHTYGGIGTYTVTLIVTDNSGSRNSAQTTAIISNPSASSLSSIAVSPATVNGGSSATGTVTLSGAAPAGGATVTLSSSNTAAAQIPPSVTVSAGASSATFSVTTSSIASSTSVTISGTYNGATKSATLTVNPVSVSGQISFVQQKSTSFSSVSTVVATLPAAPHPGSALVLFSANDNVPISSVSGGGVSWVSASSGGSHSVINIWYGLNSSGSGSAITVTYADATGSGGVNVSEFSGIATSNALDVAPATSSGVSTTPTTPTAVTNNAHDLILAAAADTDLAATTAGPTNSFIALTEAASANKIVPAYRIVSVTGSFSTSWTEGNDGWDTAIVALKASGSTSTVSLSSVAVNPATVNGGSSATGTVTLSGAAPAGGATVTLSSSNTAAAQVPASVTVSAGASSATFSVTTSSVASSTSVTITGTYNSGAQTATLTVSPASTSSLSSVAVNPATVNGGSSATGTVTLSGAAPAGGATVTLSSSNTAAAQIPPSVTVSAGASSATFSVTTSSIASSTSVTISGTYNGATKSATLTVNPVSVSGQISFVQQKSTSFSSVSTVVATLPAAPHPGSALVLFSANDNVPISSVSGGGVSWVSASSGGSHSVINIWYGLNSSGSGSAITVTYADATGSGGVNVSEFSGIATSNALDVAPATSSGVSTTPTTPTAVTNNAHDLILAAAADTDLAATTAGPTNSFIALTEAASANKIVPAYRIVSATGSFSTSWTEGNDGWDTAIVALKSQ